MTFIGMTSWYTAMKPGTVLFALDLFILTEYKQIYGFVCSKW